jgi:hypothetical protein
VSALLRNSALASLIALVDDIEGGTLDRPLGRWIASIEQQAGRRRISVLVVGDAVAQTMFPEQVASERHIENSDSADGVFTCVTLPEIVPQVDCSVVMEWSSGAISPVCGNLRRKFQALLVVGTLTPQQQLLEELFRHSSLIAHAWPAAVAGGKECAIVSRGSEELRLEFSPTASLRDVIATAFPAKVTEGCLKIWCAQALCALVPWALNAHRRSTTHRQLVEALTSSRQRATADNLRITSILTACDALERELDRDIETLRGENTVSPQDSIVSGALNTDFGELLRVHIEHLVRSLENGTSARYLVKHERRGFWAGKIPPKLANALSSAEVEYSFAPGSLQALAKQFADIVERYLSPIQQRFARKANTLAEEYRKRLDRFDRDIGLPAEGASALRQTPRLPPISADRLARQLLPVLRDLELKPFSRFEEKSVLGRFWQARGGAMMLIMSLGMLFQIVGQKWARTDVLIAALGIAVVVVVVQHFLSRSHEAFEIDRKLEEQKDAMHSQLLNAAVSMARDFGFVPLEKAAAAIGAQLKEDLSQKRETLRKHLPQSLEPQAYGRTVGGPSADVDRMAKDLDGMLLREREDLGRTLTGLR